MIAPAGKPLYSGYWFGEQQAIAARMNQRHRVQGLDDEIVEGVSEGFFISGMDSNIPEPDWNWDPEATSMYHAVTRYICEEEGTDWQLVVRRLEELAAVLPPHAGAGIEPGNAYLRLGETGDPSALKPVRNPWME